MIEPVRLADFFITFFSAAAVIVFGALYALLFAYSRIRKVPRLMPLAYAAYAVLFVAVLELAHVANLLHSPFWIFVVLLMLAGYLLAPRMIWNLCVATHPVAHPKFESSNEQLLTELTSSVESTFLQPCKEKAL